jgi:protein-S-isoprenylcysteine O-methyltransferase Ste14
MLVMAALHFLIPVRVLLTGSARLIGLIPLVVGMGVILWADRLFREAHTAIKPGEISTVLVTWGPFRISRNPIYASMVVTLAGLALLLGSLTPWLVLPLFVIALDRRFIRGEEASLAQQFGPAYQTYVAKVRRWI